MVSQTTKGIITIIGATLFHLIIGSLLSWSSINGYYTSYLKHHDSPNIQITDGYFLMPIAVFVNNAFLLLGGFLNKKINSRIISIIGLSLVLLAHLTLLFTTTFWIVALVMILFGIGNALSYMPVIKTGWIYFPKKRGTITGLITTGFGISSSIFTAIADLIINPNRENPEKDGIYSFEIAERVHTYIFVILIIFTVQGIIAISMIIPYQPEPDPRECQDPLVSTSETSSASSETLEIKRESVRQALFSAPFFQLIIMCFGTMFFAYMVPNTNRTFGDKNQLNQTMLSFMSITFSLLNGGLRTIWGMLLDKFGFKKIYVFIIINQIIMSAAFYYSAGNNILYFIVNSLVACSFSGHTSIMPTMCPRIFGLKNSLIVMGTLFISTGLSGLAGPIIAKLVIKDMSDYLIIYLSGTAFATIGLIAFCFFKDTPFVYQEKEEKIINKIAIEN